MTLSRSAINFEHVACEFNKCNGREKSAGHHSDCPFDQDDLEYQRERDASKYNPWARTRKTDRFTGSKAKAMKNSIDTLITTAATPTPSAQRTTPMLPDWFPLASRCGQILSTSTTEIENSYPCQLPSQRTQSRRQSPSCQKRGRRREKLARRELQQHCQYDQINAQERKLPRRRSSSRQDCGLRSWFSGIWGID